ncbi:DUF2721 domain-containing protein [Flagellimonas sp. CMM7]|uniref:DUF2721 domain-containing protein n=1 Tax=Flagellimonas sp. CMM7 TaxID=2654676 RepID=UPI0013D4F97F|nr:DUF2721 domain-containing protein [Flagellimonas sp. CMM7]UII80313.1 hypothetical protein LV704_02085 [Flagellimonas sp. CMM7]
MENWYLPITLLPGIALMLLSTSNLMVALNNEINDYVGSKPINDKIITRKLAQLKLLNTTMVLFYVSIAFLVISGLLGGIGLTVNLREKIMIYITIIGIVVFLLGIVCLISYSYRSVNIHQEQFKTD